MKRKSKNIIMILVLLISVMALVFTCLFIDKNYVSYQNNNFSGGNMNPQTGETQLEKPDGEMDGTMQEPLEMPNGEQNNNMTKPPEKSDVEENNMVNPPEIPGNIGSQMVTNMSIIHYLILGLECLVISIIIIYLLMSKFNKKSLKETLSTSDKIIIAILSTIILTGVLTFISGYITNKVLSNNNQMNGNLNGMGNMNNTNISYTSQNEITDDEEISNKNYSSSNANENSVLINGDIKITLDDITVLKTGDSDGGDNTSFYGINSAIMAKSGANLTIKNSNIETKATGANGVFSYGGSATTNNTSNDGTTITISDSKITTTKDNSGGIMTTGGGIMYANNLTIETAGTSSAAIRTDRGGGTVEVSKGTYTTTGSGSPAVYSTAKISVKDAKLISKASEGIVIEGKNSVSIDNVELIDSNTKLNGLSTTYKNIFLYQSMSGDASVGNAEFTAKSSKITTNNGDTFYITNTNATINLTNNTIINNDSNGNFLRTKKDSWGNNGSNGGIVTLVMNNQEANGNIEIDSISTLDMRMNDGSYYVGMINKNNEAKYISLKLDRTSKIKLTGDSYVTSFENEITDNSNINFNGYTLYVNGKSLN